MNTDYNDEQNYTYRNYRNETDPYYNQLRRPQPVSGMSIAALILGILSIICCCCGIGGVVLGTTGIIISIISRKEGPMQTNAKIGLGLSVTGLVLGLIMTIFLIVFYINSDSTDWNRTYDFYEYHQTQPYESSPYNDIQKTPYSRELDDYIDHYGHQEV